MTPTTTTDPAYAGASQPAAEVAGRAVGRPTTDVQRAARDGYYTPPDGVRRKIRAGDPIPPGVTLEGTEATTSSTDAGRIAELEAELDAERTRVAELEASSGGTERISELEAAVATAEQERDDAKRQAAESDKARKAAEDKARKASENK